MPSHVLLHDFIVDPSTPRRIIELASENGLTLGDLDRRYMANCELAYICVINSKPVLRSQNWDSIAIDDAIDVHFIVIPRGGGRGGKNPLGLILMLALTVVTYGAGAALGATAATGYSLGAAAASAVPGLTTAAGALTAGGQLLAAGVNFAIIAGGSMLINALLKPSTAKPEETPNPSYSVMLRGNQARIGQAIEVQYGRVLSFPSMASAPYSEFSPSTTQGNGTDFAGDMKFYALYCLGWGRYDIEEVRIMDRSVDEFPDQIKITQYEPGEVVDAFPSSVITYPLSAPLELIGPNVTRSNEEQEPIPGTERETANNCSIDFVNLRGTLYLDGSTALPGGDNALVGSTVFWTRPKNYVFSDGSSRHTEYQFSARIVSNTAATKQIVFEFPANGAIASSKNFSTGFPYCIPNATQTAGTEWAVEVRSTTSASDNQIMFNGYSSSASRDEANHTMTITLGGAYNDGVTGMSPQAVPLPENAYVGDLLLFIRPKDNLNKYRDFWANIVSNTGTTITVYVPPGSHLEKSTATPGANWPVKIHRPRNYIGPFSINPTSRDPLITSIAYDMIAPNGVGFMQGADSVTPKFKPIPIGIRAEYREIETSGEPVPGAFWKPIGDFDGGDGNQSADAAVKGGGAPSGYYGRVPNIILAGTKGIDVMVDVALAGGTNNAYQMMYHTNERQLGSYGNTQYIDGAACFLPGWAFPAGNTDIAQAEATTHAINVPATRSPLRTTTKMEVPAGRYQVRFRRCTVTFDPSKQNKNATFAETITIAGVRGYGRSEKRSWPGRTMLAVELTASAEVNSSTLKELSVLSTRILSDYAGTIEPGDLPNNPFSTFRLSSVLITGGTHLSKLTKAGIEQYASRGSYVTLSGWSNSENNGTFLVDSVEADTIYIRSTLASESSGTTKYVAMHQVRVKVPTDLVDNMIDGTLLKFEDVGGSGGTIGGVANAVFEREEGFACTVIAHDTVTIELPAENPPTSSDTDGSSLVKYSQPIGGEWTDPRPTRSPSAAIIDMATDLNYGGRQALSRLQLDSLKARALTWEQRDRWLDNSKTVWNPKPVRDYYDFRFEERMPVLDALQMAARAGRARVITPGGQISVVRDEPRPVASAALGPRDIRDGFTFGYSYPNEDKPDHLKVEYVDENYWDTNEITISKHPEFLPYQLLRIGNPVAGSYTLGFQQRYRDPVVTSGLINYDNSTVAIQGILEDALGAGNVLVTDTGTTAGGTELAPLSEGGPIKIELVGDYAGIEFQEIVATPINLTNGVLSITREANPAYPGERPIRLRLQGVVQHQHAWREGKYEFGVNTLRTMFGGLTTDLSGLLARFGSRIEVSHEIGDWGQYGLITDYVETEEGASLFTSVPLDWGTDPVTDSSHVMQLRDMSGKPSAAGLFHVRPGKAVNEAEIVLGEGETGIDTVAIGLWTRDGMLREATPYSFGLTGKHVLNLLVSGVRPQGRNKVALEFTEYREDGIYDADSDLEYSPPLPFEELDRLPAAPAVTNVQASYSTTTGDLVASVSWDAARGATGYYVEVSYDEGETWFRVEKITGGDTVRHSFELSDPIPESILVVDALTVGTHNSRTELETVLYRRPASDPTPWKDGEFDGMTVQFISGRYENQTFRIRRTDALRQSITLDVTLKPKPLSGDDQFSIYSEGYRPVLIGVRAVGRLIGPRNYVTLRFGNDYGQAGPAWVAMQDGGFTLSRTTGLGVGGTQPERVELLHVDEDGNLTIRGNFIAASSSPDLAAAVYVGEPVPGGVLPEAPRGGNAILLFDDSGRLIHRVGGDTPASGEYAISETDGVTLIYGDDPPRYPHFLMVSAAATINLSGLHVGVECSFTPSATSATVPFTPLDGDEVMLWVNGYQYTKIDTGSPVTDSKEFLLVGSTAYFGHTLETGDVVIALGLSSDATATARRFRCLRWTGDTTLPMTPLLRTEVAVFSDGIGYWYNPAPGFGEFGLSGNASTGLVWGSGQPVAGSIKYSVGLTAGELAEAVEINSSPPFLVAQATGASVNERRLVDGLNSTVSDGGPGGDISIDFAGGLVGNAGVYDLDTSGFDSETYEFENLLPVEPDLTGGKSVVLLLENVGPLYRMQDDATPTPGRFALYGPQMRHVRFNSTHPPDPAAGTALYAAGSTFAPPRYLVLTASVPTPLAGIPFAEWVIPDDVTVYLPAGAPGSWFKATTQATGEDAVFPIDVDLGDGFVSAGDLTVPVGTKIGVFTVPSSQTLTGGCVIRMMNPIPANASLANIKVALRLAFSA